MATTSQLFGTSTAITCTINSLANSATVGRQSTVIDNTSNLFDDALVTTIVTTAGSVAAPLSVFVYVSGSEDGTNFDQDDGVFGASDAAYTINSFTNLKLGAVISTPTTAKVYNSTFSVARLFGGNMPRKWAIVVVNNSGATLSGSGNSATYTGMKETIA